MRTGKNQVLLRNFARKEVERLEPQADLPEIDAGDAVLLAQSFERRQVGDSPLRGKTRRETPPLLLGERALQLVRSQRALPKQDLSESASCRSSGRLSPKSSRYGGATS